MYKILKWLGYIFFLICIGILTFIIVLTINIYNNLPSFSELEEYQPKITTRIHGSDGQLLKEFAKERRLYVPIEQIPENLKTAFIVAEDKRFYDHIGIDLPAIFRAILVNLKRIPAGLRPIGASTITQQVARNFLLSNELSIIRKVREQIIALAIDNLLTKEKILELYLNKIYMGVGNYGVASSALAYFNKSLSELEWHEIAYLASLPKAPSNYHPIRNPAAAIIRRNWVLSLLHENNFISKDELDLFSQKPLSAKIYKPKIGVEADYFVEEVRKELLTLFDENSLYEGGLYVRTSLDPRLQSIANNALRSGLKSYDKRHGYRGVIATIENLDNPAPELEVYLKKNAKYYNHTNFDIAVVTEIAKDDVEIQIFADTFDTKQGLIKAKIPLEYLTWAREFISQGKLGKEITNPSQVLNLGDVILVEGVDIKKSIYRLEQEPNIDGAIIALDNHTGRIKAMVGGFSFLRSEFNRATQAFRQPGSAFKPFVYLAALENNISPSTRILDAPIVIDNGLGLARWRPENYSRVFYGPTMFRIGVEKSRNLMTIRLAMHIGIDPIIDVATKFDINQNIERNYSIALGTAETSLLKLASAYAMIANGGYRIKPSLIDVVENSKGQAIYKPTSQNCYNCNIDFQFATSPPNLDDNRERIANSREIYQLTSILKGVITNGTGRGVASLNLPIAGKTGTTDLSRDTWFMGYSPNLTIGVYVGFDAPKPLGDDEQGFRETGASTALPIWRDFVKNAMNDPNAIVDFNVPSNVKFLRVNTKTGTLSQSSDDESILEVFKSEEIISDSVESLLITGSNSNNEVEISDDEKSIQDALNISPIDMDDKNDANPKITPKGIY